MGRFTGQPEFPIDLKLRFHGRSVDKNIGMAIFRAEVIRLMLQWAILSTEQDAVHPGFSLWT